MHPVGHDPHVAASAPGGVGAVETGLTVQVPEYLKEGEKIKIDTRTGEYISRA